MGADRLLGLAAQRGEGRVGGRGGFPERGEARIEQAGGRGGGIGRAGGQRELGGFRGDDGEFLGPLRVREPEGARLAGEVLGRLVGAGQGFQGLGLPGLQGRPGGGLVRHALADGGQGLGDARASGGGLVQFPEDAGEGSGPVGGGGRSGGRGGEAGGIPVPARVEFLQLPEQGEDLGVALGVSGLGAPVEEGERAEQYGGEEGEQGRADGPGGGHGRLLVTGGELLLVGCPRGGSEAGHPGSCKCSRSLLAEIGAAHLGVAQQLRGFARQGDQAAFQDIGAARRLQG